MATIAWGDDTTDAATLTAMGNGLFKVTGDHIYTSIGQQTATIIVTDDAGVSYSTTSSVEVGNLYAGVQGDLTLATFTDTTTGVTAQSFIVSIDWGDGSTGSGAVTQSGSNFTVTASHAFAVDSIDNAGGVYLIQVAIAGDSNSQTLTIPLEVTPAARLPCRFQRADKFGNRPDESGSCILQRTGRGRWRHRV